ncbi:MAG TPA: hypothetical protein VFP47_13150, partial [Pyrinomonadaceae bacterium]|nr:hypothetical protein [Pyrinomonadaceae bacterium]
SRFFRYSGDSFTKFVCLKVPSIISPTIVVLPFKTHEVNWGFWENLTSELTTEKLQSNKTTVLYTIALTTSSGK